MIGDDDDDDAVISQPISEQSDPLADRSGEKVPLTSASASPAYSQ